AEVGIRHRNVTGVQTCALPISCAIATLQSLFPSPPWCPASVTAFGEDSCAHESAAVLALREGGHYGRPGRHRELAPPEMPGGPRSEERRVGKGVGAGKELAGIR